MSVRAEQNNATQGGEKKNRAFMRVRHAFLTKVTFELAFVLSHSTNPEGHQGQGISHSL